MEIKGKNILFTIVILILIVLNFLLLYLLKNDIGKIEYQTPTGNIDVFHIDCDCKDTEKTETVFGDNSVGEKLESNPIYNEDGSILINDENGNWNYQNKLKIFENPAFEMKELIAPGSTNVYQFVIYNNADNKMEYAFKMSEINDNRINMKYRLKLNGEYIIGNDKTWVTAEKLHKEGLFDPIHKKGLINTLWSSFDKVCG